MNVILSIKPKFCEAIQRGEKRYEFRKRVFKHRDEGDVVFMYATAPVKKIVGLFTIDSIFHGEPVAVWAKCKEGAGLSKAEFFQYFGNSKDAFAFKIKEVQSFKPIDPRTEIPGFIPPQSFCYAKASFEYPDSIESGLQWRDMDSQSVAE